MTTRITAYPDGPLIVRGDFVVDDIDGAELDVANATGGPGAAVALCRCGRSALKPLCDGSHKLARRRSPRRSPRGDAS